MYPSAGASLQLVPMIIGACSSHKEPKALLNSRYELQARTSGGNRIDYVKGFYDNFLGECKADTLKIRLSFFPPESHIEDVREGNIPLNYVVTPKGVFEFCAEKK